jgi:hypothetical protein
LTYKVESRTTLWRWESGRCAEWSIAEQLEQKLKLATVLVCLFKFLTSFLQLLQVFRYRQKVNTALVWRSCLPMLATGRLQ